MNHRTFTAYGQCLINMADSDEKVYTLQTIDDTPLPGNIPDDLSVSSEGKATGEDFKYQSINDNPLPTRKIAHEIIGKALNTKSKHILGEFQFTNSGAIRIGNYTEGQAGEILISPSGIVARNTNGDITVSIDGETGDAVFAGVIQTGSLISGKVQVGDDAFVIDGETKQMLIYNNNIPQILIGYQENGF